MKTVLVFLFLLSFPSPMLAQSDVELVHRAKRFYSHFSAAEFSYLWAMLSPRLKRENDYDRQKYIANFAGYEKLGLRIRILDAAAKRNIGNVKVETCLPPTVTPDVTPRCNTIRTRWIRKRGAWYYDGE